LDIIGEAYTTMLSGTPMEDAMATVTTRTAELEAQYNS
jgi:hypothetical protein